MSYGPDEWLRQVVTAGELRLRVSDEGQGRQVRGRRNTLEAGRAGHPIQRYCVAVVVPHTLVLNLPRVVGM